MKRNYLNNTFFYSLIICKKYKVFIKPLQPIEMQLTQRLSTDYIYPAIPSGLPNLGNTCFLNSVIQMLYTIPSIHNLFQTLDQRSQQKEFLVSIASQLFFLMGQSNRKGSQIKKAVRQLARRLEIQMSNYTFGNQYDSLETFLCFLDAFFNKDIRLSQEFQIMYSIKCKCPNMNLNITQVKIQSEPSRCQSCSTPFIKQISKFPRYLLLIGKKCEHFIRQLYKKDVYYIFLSQNIYHGSGNSGHYYSICNYNKRRYVFNDSSVSQQGQSNDSQSILFSIYQRCDRFQDPKKVPSWFSIKKFLIILGTIMLAVIIFFALQTQSQQQLRTNGQNIIKYQSEPKRNGKKIQKKSQGKNKENQFQRNEK